jgi:hypothetical protein
MHRGSFRLDGTGIIMYQHLFSHETMTPRGIGHASTSRLPVAKMLVANELA